MIASQIKNAIARCALSGVSTSLEKTLPGIKLVDCDVRIGSPRSVQIVVVDDNGWPRQFDFTVTETLG